MKIIDQSHEIISLPDNLLQIIEAAGRTCYKSEDKIGCLEKLDHGSLCPDMELDRDLVCCIKSQCSVHSSHKFTRMLIDRGHHAMIEFGDIIVRFVTNRGVLAELSRHRLVSLAVESTRYVRYDGNMEFIRPVWCSKQLCGNYKDAFPENISDDEFSFWTYCLVTEEAYKNMLRKGWRPEQAREVLPNSLKTEIVVKANVREWRHIFDLRCSKKAHPQIRALMLPLLKELKEKVPVLFDDLYPGI